MRTTTLLTAILCLGLIAAGCDDETTDTDDDDSASSSSGSSGTGANCGDGVLNGTDQCDGMDLGGATCEALSFEGGTLVCGGDCILDTNGCHLCNDGVKAGPEECDGTDLGGATCESLGAGVGQPSCTDGCLLDTGNCCQPQCTGKNCGPDTCGGECGPCDSPDACCDGTCVAAPESCSCTCVCSLQSNPNCQSVQVTNSVEGETCNSLCQNACSMGCGSMVSSTGDCPLQATCD